MTSARNRDEAKKKWAEIVAEVESERNQLREEIQQLRAEKESLNKTVKAAKTRATTIAELESSVSKTLNQANAAASEVTNANKAVTTAAERAKQLEEKAERLEARARANNRTVDQLLDRSDKAALSGDFKAYARAYQIRADIYLMLIVATVATFIYVLLKFKLLEFPASGDLFILVAYAVRKIAIAAPFVYLVIIFSGMQAEARRLERAYRFKTAVALSLKANKELLAELYGKEYAVKQADGSTVYPVAEFAKGTISGNIYQVPEEGPVRATPKEEPGLSYFATRQTKRGLKLLKELAAIIKDVK
jgi:DNA repair exonuclease SbcCD ATPase subunit